VSEQDLGEEDADELDEGTGGGGMPVVLRALGIVLLFLFIGPPIGGYALLVIAFVMKAAVHGIDWARLSDAFLGAMFFTGVFSYVFGGVVALLTGVMVAVSRIAGGQTTILTPIFAAVAANGLAVLLNMAVATNSLELRLPGKVPLTAGLLPSSIFAAILCWLLAKKWKLA
jgi:hypothetical protein